MGDIVVRVLADEDYDGVRQVDVLTQRHYRGATWDHLPAEDKEEHLVTRRSDFTIYLNAGYCFVASIDNEIVAFLFAYEELPFRGGLNISYIGVSPAYQKQGIGVLLYRKLIEKAKSHGIKMLTALINLDNPHSLGLHQRVGFVLQDRKEAKLTLR